MKIKYQIVQYFNDNLYQFTIRIDVIIVSELSGEHKIGHYIKNDYEGKLKPRLEVVKEDMGTADVLRAIKDKIRVLYLTDLLAYYCYSKLTTQFFLYTRMISL